MKSVGEETLMLQLRADRITGWVREFRFCERRFRFDFAFPERKLAIEIGGGVWANGRHQRGSGFTSDAEKYSLAAIHGYRLIHATTAQVKSGKAIQWIKEALR